MQTESEFDAYVDTYDEDHRKSIWLSGETPDFFADYKIRTLARIVQNHGLDASRILDFGAGIGNSLPPFRKHFPDADLTLSDVSLESLNLAAERFGGTEKRLHLENDRLPTDENSFDLIFSACVFHHIDESEHVKWLEELRRVTRPNGLIVIFEHNPLNPLTQYAVAKCPFDKNAVLVSAPKMSRRLTNAGWQQPHAQFNMFFPAALSAMRKFEPLLSWCPLGAQYACIGRAPE